jgi:uncharacterized protein (TIGR03084 family)
MFQEAVDLRAEADELHAFLLTLGAADWERETAFQRWTPWDVVAHLHFFDHASLAALAGREVFASERDALMAAIRAGRTNAQIARERFGKLSPRELVESWHAACLDLADRLGARDPSDRLPWYGPDMGVRMFTTARLMETWAHGQEIYDLMRVVRKPTDRLKHIATIGVKTFGWTFANRGLPAPPVPPHVRLEAPSGAIWEWNDPAAESRVTGDALDFCQVVTQTRNVADTRLEVVGDAATRWMAIAQCFAGGPADPPEPGERAWR